MSMVRLPALAGSESLSPPDSPLKSFPWIRFVADIVREQDGGSRVTHEVGWKKRKGRGSELGGFNIPTQPPVSIGDTQVTSSASSIMSVRIFPPSDEKHDDFEFPLDRFMGKWLVVFTHSECFFSDFLVGMSPIRLCHFGR